VLRTESPALAVNIAEFLQPYIGAAWRLSRVMLSIKTMGLPGFLLRSSSPPIQTRYFDTVYLDQQAGNFYPVGKYRLDIETPTAKRCKYAEPTGNLHGDSFEPVPRSRVEL
jgi:hypothetical protein